MGEYGPATYGDSVAPHYDDWYSSFDETAVALLARLAGAGPALELGIGTGRMALPLAARGVEVHGVDASHAMIGRLRAKPGGARLTVHLADFADLSAVGGGKFALAYVVFNTFFVLQTQEAQLRCFSEVARLLAPGGAFLVEAFVPDLSRFTAGSANKATKVTADRVEIEASEHYPAAQRVVSQKIVLADGEPPRLFPVVIRYCWPSELDLMARLAGLRLRERTAGWRGEPFTDASTQHVSIYERGK